MTSGNKGAVQGVIRRAEELGCSVEYRKAGHWKITLPDGQIVFCSSTPSDFRAVKSLMSTLRRKGVKL